MRKLLKISDKHNILKVVRLKKAHNIQKMKIKIAGDFTKRRKIIPDGKMEMCSMKCFRSTIN